VAASYQSHFKLQMVGNELVEVKPELMSLGALRFLYWRQTSPFQLFTEEAVTCEMAPHHL
jgi:hypothetical protein